MRALRVEPDRVVIDERFAARVVIGADGANSVVRRLTGAPPTPPRAVAVAIRGYAPVAARPDELVIEFARGRYPAYAWAFPVAGGGANVGFGVFDRRGGGSRRELLAALYALLPGQEPDPATIRGHHLPLSTGPRHHPDGRVLLVGDAAALVNPLTGEGIYDAVASGALAGRAALNGAARARAGPTARRCGGLSDATAATSPCSPGSCPRPVPRRRGRRRRPRPRGVRRRRRPRPGGWHGRLARRARDHPGARPEWLTTAPATTRRAEGAGVG